MNAELKYRLTVEDYAALVNARGLRRYLGQPPALLWYLLACINLGVVVAFVVLGNSTGRHLWIPGAISLFCFAAPSLYWLMLRREFALQKLGQSEIFLTLGEAALIVKQDEMVSEIGFNAITRFDDRGEHVLLWLHGRQAIILPKKVLSDATADLLRKRIAQAHNERS